jgi:KipI family sensor histidine kinase inhibitor
VSTVTIEPLGDSAALIRLGDVIDDRINRTAIALSAALHANALPGLIDAAPAFASVCVRFDAMRWSHEALANVVEHALASLDIDAQTDTEDVIEIPVCYDGEFGPDLQDVADHAGASIEHVIDLHTRGAYTVAMLGFMPGFPYLRGLDARLQTPRRATPRLRVPTGSVAIGGAQTGIYPREVPGGWNLIGRTPLSLFDATRALPALLRAGQRVAFSRIDAAHFANWPT